jgi:branched-chain amino acid aminotransferase
MVIIDYTAGLGWHDHRVVPNAPFLMDPATMVLH